MADAFIPFTDQQRRKNQYDGKIILLMKGLKAHTKMIDDLKQIPFNVFHHLNRPEV